MEERRRTPRIKEENEVTITVFSEEENLPKEKIINNFTKDISAGGTKIHTNILLPVDTLIELEFTSKGLREQINALGRVRWVKVLIEDQSYEAGVEFEGTPNEALKKLGDYISWKLKSEKIIKKKLSPVETTDVLIQEGKEQSAEGTDEGQKVAVEGAQEPKSVPPESGNVRKDQESPSEQKAVTIQETPPSSLPGRRWILTAFVSVALIGIVAFWAKTSGLFPEIAKQLSPERIVGMIYVLFALAVMLGVYGVVLIVRYGLLRKDRRTLWSGVGFLASAFVILIFLATSMDAIYLMAPPGESPGVSQSAVQEKAAPEGSSLRLPPDAGTKSVTKETSASSVAVEPAAGPPPAGKGLEGTEAKPGKAAEAEPKGKVIGNSDTKRYHLPGMMYYHAVKPYHRVEFDSEEEAIKAGYHKAPR